MNVIKDYRKRECFTIMQNRARGIPLLRQSAANATIDNLNKQLDALHSQLLFVAVQRDAAYKRIEDAQLEAALKRSTKGTE